MEPTNYPHTKLQQPSTLKSAEMVKSTLTRSQQGAKFPPVRVLSPGAAGLRVMFSHPATPLLSEEVGPSIQTSTRLSPVRVLSTVTIPPPPAPLPSGGAGPSMTKTVPFSPVCVLSTVTIPPPLAPFSSGGAGSSTQTGA
uniref:Uncharacterized protein n=1 Tax=Anopheles quadriannulatus TaxID=34691 RepID=A0A182XSB7_ANOQN